eukprot:scaffold357_cov400-Prasinococcus_capsulatus_cf.AAC.10
MARLSKQTLLLFALVAGAALLFTGASAQCSGGACGGSAGACWAGDVGRSNHVSHALVRLGCRCAAVCVGATPRARALRIAVPTTRMSASVAGVAIPSHALDPAEAQPQEAAGRQRSRPHDAFSVLRVAPCGVCDELCESFADCCADKTDECGGTEPGTCEGNCGGSAGTCWYAGGEPGRSSPALRLSSNVGPYSIALRGSPGAMTCASHSLTAVQTRRTSVARRSQAHARATAAEAPVSAGTLWFGDCLRREGMQRSFCDRRSHAPDALQV